MALGTEDPCALWFAVPEAPAEAQGGEPQSWSGQGKSREPLVAGIPTALAGSQGEPTHDPLPPQTDSTSSRISQWPCAVAPPLPERRSAAGEGGAGLGSQGPEPERRDRSWGRSFGTSGAAHRDPRGRRRAPLSNPRSPHSVPAGRSRPPGVTWRRQSLILLPGRSLRAAVPPGTGRHPPPRPGPTSPSLGV